MEPEERPPLMFGSSSIISSGAEPAAHIRFKIHE
jgi:hypothetical protein